MPATKSKSSPKKSKSSPKKSPSKKGSPKKKSFDSYKSYIYKVLKQVHPDTGISSAAMAETDALCHYFVKTLIEGTNEFRRVSGRSMLSARDVQSSVRSRLPGELAKHAVSEGTKAVAKFATSIENASHGTKKNRAKPVAASARAGLQFAPSRIRKDIMKYNSAHACKCRISTGAVIYLASVIEYLVAEILELSGNAARDNKAVRISTTHITMAIHNDQELEELLRRVTLPSSAGKPHIHSVLLPKKQQ